MNHGEVTVFNIDTMEYEVVAGKSVSIFTKFGRFDATITEAGGIEIYGSQLRGLSGLVIQPRSSNVVEVDFTDKVS